MPRMLTLWLDCTQKKFDIMAARQSGGTVEANTEEANEKEKLDIQKVIKNASLNLLLFR